MFAIRPGRAGPPRSLDDMLRSRWEDIRKSNNDELKRRESSGVPLDDGGGPLEEIGEYESNDEYSNLFVTIRSVSRREVMETDIRIKEISESVKTTEEAVEKLRSDLETFDAMKEFCKVAIVRVDGFEDDDGNFSIVGDPGLSSEQVNFLDECNLLFPLFACAKSFQYLEAEEKKLYGLRAPSIYPTPRSIAVNAESLGESFSVVTEAPEVNGSKVRGTRDQPVHGGYPSDTIGSGTVSSFTEAPKGS